jgi:hypothetical protein
VNQTCGSLVAATVLTFFVSAALPAQTVIEQLYAQRKFEMADAYWLAGQKFTDLGQKERGDEFKAHALKLFPGYVAGVTPVFAPTQVPAANGETSEASASVAGEPEAPEPTIPDANVVREQNLQGEKIVKLAWNKLLRGFLSGNAETVRSVLSDTLTLPPEGNSDPSPNAVSASDSPRGSGLATAELAPSIEAFFTDHPLDLASPEELYVTSSVKLSAGTEAGSVKLQVQAQPEAPAELAALFTFWKPEQTFTFVRSGDTWKLASISGQ